MIHITLLPGDGASFDLSVDGGPVVPVSRSTATFALRGGGLNAVQASEVLDDLVNHGTAAFDILWGVRS
jgi:hypothetical protein